MGIRLDWEIESDRAGTYDAREDPENLRLRRRAQIRILVVIFFLAAILGGIGLLVVWQLNQTDAYIETLLRNTVEAEVAALRIGDWDAYSETQRSANDEWTLVQRGTFEGYQNLKLTNDLQLTGTVRDVEIDGLRARVMVEEIIDGVPFSQVWFYWRYADGWRHVPPDYTFWGVAQEYQGKDMSVSYSGVDEALALELGIKVESWIADTCNNTLQCGDLPHISVSIIPDNDLTVDWNPNNPWTLIVPSPYVDRARSDLPFSGQLKVDVADRLADRLVSESLAIKDPAVYPRDAYYLRPAVKSWLVGRFVQLNTNSHLVTSLAENYGQEAVGRMLQSLTPDASMAMLAGVVGVNSIAEAQLDWRDLLTWRLQLEHELAELSRETDFVALYDPALADLARQRFNTPTTDPQRAVVTLAPVSTGTDGVPFIDATVRYGEGDSGYEAVVRFRLIDNVWRRAS